ncbi:970_t:CDS:1 [Cetraspora pellucida]|uniref:970_t:CDS:1 n=1 Tax=Cetraspora pellucida TaxID=1433469 RepID=A0A9N9PI64_9GLOM|nr:970_t:CDS:1 [Cetraspora pellucida]
MSNNIDDNLNPIDDCLASSSANKKSNPEGQPRAEVWNSYTIDTKNRKYYSIRCQYCSKYWQRGIPFIMESHLANECSNCSQENQNYWQDKINNRNNNYQRTSKTKTKHTTHDTNNLKSHSINVNHQNSLDRAVLKA